MNPILLPAAFFWMLCGLGALYVLRLWRWQPTWPVAVALLILGPIALVLSAFAPVNTGGRR